MWVAKKEHKIDCVRDVCGSWRRDYFEQDLEFMKDDIGKHYWKSPLRVYIAFWVLFFF